MYRVIPAFLVTVLALSACAQSTNQKIFEVKGIVLGLAPQEKQVRVKHDEIPGYMAAMTMWLDVKNTNELSGLETNDTIAFRLVDAGNDAWIEGIKKTGTASAVAVRSTASFRLAHDVEPLSEGDLLPEYRFTNHLGRAFSTKDFKGQALAITFVFTRCPYPTYCPLMANNFGEAQKKLFAMPHPPTNWHMLTISFDPEYDTPAVLNRYAQLLGHNPKHSTYATGALIDVTAIGQQLGLTFWRDDTGSISHNLRTVVIDTTGRIRRIFGGNQWTPEDLATEIAKAAAVK